MATLIVKNISKKVINRDQTFFLGYSGLQCRTIESELEQTPAYYRKKIFVNHEAFHFKYLEIPLKQLVRTIKFGLISENPV
jgi:hypothetical protein